MSSLPEAMRSLTQVFSVKLQDFTDEIENVHMLWLEEIQQEAQRMFSRYDFIYTVNCQHGGKTTDVLIWYSVFVWSWHKLLDRKVRK